MYLSSNFALTLGYLNPALNNPALSNIYTLFDGLAYNTYGYFASCVVFFRAPQGRGKLRAMSKMLFHYKKNYLAIGFYFLVRVFRDILILSVRMTLTISKMFARVICQTIEWEVNYFIAKEKWYLGFYFLTRVSKTSWFCQPWLLLLHPPVFALL